MCFWRHVFVRWRLDAWNKCRTCAENSLPGMKQLFWCARRNTRSMRCQWASNRHHYRHSIHFIIRTNFEFDPIRSKWYDLSKMHHITNSIVYDLMQKNEQNKSNYTAVSPAPHLIQLSTLVCVCFTNSQPQNERRAVSHMSEKWSKKSCECVLMMAFEPVSRYVYFMCRHSMANCGRGSVLCST